MLQTDPTKKIEEGFIGQMMLFVPHVLLKKASVNCLMKRFHLTAIGYYPNAAFHDRSRKRGSPHYILLYCVGGQGKINIQGKSTDLKPNTFIILPKNIPHHYASSASDPWSIYWLHFTGEHADFLFQRYMETRLSEVPYNQARIDLFETIYHLADCCINEREFEICQVKLLDFISSLIYIKEINPSLKEANIVSQSIDFMKLNLHRKLSLKDFALQQRLSVSHYSRLFRTRTGRSPTHYFNELKIQKSCQYLYFTDRNIKEICTILGFDDPFYFSRMFKKRMGTSPANYKNQHKRY